MMGGGKPSGKQAAQGDLFSVKIGIGDIVQLQDFAASRQYHYVKLIGYLNKKSVLVTHPMQDEKLLFVKKGKAFWCAGSREPRLTSSLQT